jgi:hypothetical protein
VLPAMPSSCKHCKVIDIFESQEQLVAIITFTDSACDVQLTDAVNAWSVQGGADCPNLACLFAVHAL